MMPGCRREGGMQHIAEWLEDIGLSEYSQRFAENGVDISVLPHLSDQDLKELGVLLGHRRKMLSANRSIRSRRLLLAAFT